MHSDRILGLSTSFFAITKYIFIAIAALATFLVLVGVPLIIQGESMEPNFHTGELVVIERLSYWGEKPVKRGDVVAAVFPGDPKKTRLIKRVIGLPGETVEAKNGQLKVNGQELAESYQPIIGEPPYQELGLVTLKADEYFLAGDNRPGSSDSRLWGPVVRSDIQGRASYIIWPLKDVRYIDRIY